MSNSKVSQLLGCKYRLSMSPRLLEYSMDRNRNTMSQRRLNQINAGTKYSRDIPYDLQISVTFSFAILRATEIMHQ